MRTTVTACLLAVSLAPLAGCGRGGAKSNPPLVLSSALKSGSGLNAGGESPLWALQIRAKSVNFSSEKISAITLTNVGPTGSKNSAVWSGEAGGRPFHATITALACKDAATGLTYPLSADVEALGFTYQGCAAKAGQGLGPRG
jgi:uncharacterized membrane protein